VPDIAREQVAFHAGFDEGHDGIRGNEVGYHQHGDAARRLNEPLDRRDVVRLRLAERDHERARPKHGYRSRGFGKGAHHRYRNSARTDESPARDAAAEIQQHDFRGLRQQRIHALTPRPKVCPARLKHNSIRHLNASPYASLRLARSLMSARGTWKAASYFLREGHENDTVTDAGGAREKRARNRPCEMKSKNTCDAAPTHTEPAARSCIRAAPD
jgi:hypothetical protein